MNGARFKWCTGPAALLAVSAFMFGAPAQAADFGGDCCADLEERIAELEATTVRKGNRKVSLTVTGWVGSQVMFWDDGGESNVYIVQDSTDLASNVTFTGSAQINSDWSAGYLINVFFDDTNSLLVDQDNDDAGPGVNVQRSFWFLQSKTYGKLSVGLQSAAADNSSLGTDFSGTLFPANNVTFDGANFALRSANGTLANSSTLGAGTFGGNFFCTLVGAGTANDCAGDRTNAVRYDTPTFGGFNASFSYGEDDRWEVTGRFANESNGWKFSAAASFAESSDFDPAGAGNVEYFQAGATIKHLQTALWLHGTYGTEDVANAAISGGDGWYVKAGWSPKFNQLGTTHFWFEYGGNDDSHGAYADGSGAVCGAFFQAAASGAIGSTCATDADTNINIASSEALRLGAGVLQEIDAASMNLFAKWRMLEAELTSVDTNTGVQTTEEFEELQMFLVGAVIFF